MFIQSENCECSYSVQLVGVFSVSLTVSDLSISDFVSFAKYTVLFCMIYLIVLCEGCYVVCKNTDLEPVLFLTYLKVS